MGEMIRCYVADTAEVGSQEVRVHHLSRLPWWQENIAHPLHLLNAQVDQLFS